MQVKDIRIVREFYKTNIKRTSDTDRNPHFAGEEKEINGVTQFGFFEMFNGQGEIENKLTTILNIAGDSQAIYEFMQNAVDANSKNFFLAKTGPEDQPYLIVLNDGEYFTLQSVVSILAIGASSKYRNPDNIGQFGVGFKLAHRLIGADNSIRELLEENKGPILFSWCNQELAELANIDNLNYIDPECEGVGKDAVSNSTAPWLFKIVATNFPCLQNDVVWDAKGSPSTGLFTQQDFVAVQGAVKQCLEQVKEAKAFKSGTLLVIPLHPGKVEHVLGKVPKGLEVAATIISRRANKPHDLRTQIGTDELEPEHLHAEKMHLSEEETKGELGNEQVKSVELMFLYGNPFDTNPFKAKPQFYRYFPMSLEQHGFRFAIHSNALTLSSARTELQENNSNKFLFNKLVPYLTSKLKDYLQKNPNRFCHLYCSILLSNKGEGNGNTWIQGRQWLEDAIWLPLMKVLKDTLPVKLGDSFQIAEEPQNVLIKNSNLPIEGWYKKKHAGWFFWEEKEYGLVCAEARQKLGLNSISILDVLSDPASISDINFWLSKYSDHAIHFFKELNQSLFDGYEKTYDKTLIWKNINHLNLWWFGNSSFSIEVLSKEERYRHNLINYGPLNEIQERLYKTGVFVSSHFLGQYDKIERSIRDAAQGLLPYLLNYEQLNKLLSVTFSSTKELNTEDKVAIFNSIETAVRGSANVSRRIETMKPLALFSNKQGEVKPLFQLTSVPNVPKMLQGWRIMEGETIGVNVKEYLSDTREAIYEHIIKPFWEDIAGQSDQNAEDRSSLFSFAKTCFTLRPTMGPLPAEAVFFTESGERQKPFYHQSLSVLKETDYKVLSRLLTKIGIPFPQLSLLPFYSAPPFLIPVAHSFNLNNFDEAVTGEELKVLIGWLINAFPAVINDYIYCNDEAGTIRIKPRKVGSTHYISDYPEIHAYIALYLNDVLLPLPEVLSCIIGANVLQGEKLVTRLIHDAETNKGCLKEMIAIVQKYGNDQHKQKLLSVIEPIELSTLIEIDSIEYLIIKLCFSISDEQLQIKTLGKLTYVTIGGSNILLGDIENRGSDCLFVEHPKKGKIPFSVNNLLGGRGNAVNQLLSSTVDLWVKLGLGSAERLALVFGINRERKAQEVWKSFLQNLQNGRIQNGQQLAFIWAIGGIDELMRYNPVVETLRGWLPLTGPFYLDPLEFIPREKVLKPNYDLSIALKGKDELLSGRSWSIQKAPYLEENYWVMPGIKEISVKDRGAFWKHLFDAWVINGNPDKIHLDDARPNWEPLLGLMPSKFILPEEYALPEETVPLQQLINYGVLRSDTYELMAALGAQGDGAAVVKTRRFFKGGGGNIDTSMSVLQTVATLKWLSINAISVIRDDISSFYRNLAGKENELKYFPAYTPASEGLKLIPISSEVFFLTKEELQTSIQNELKVQDFANAANAAVINLAILQDWSSYLAVLTKPLDIKWNKPDWEKVQDEKQELNFLFYKEWKSRYPHFAIFKCSGSDVPRKIVVNGKTIKSFRKGKILVSKEKTAAFVGEVDTEQFLNLIGNSEAFNQNARSFLHQCYKSEAEQFEKFILLAKNDLGFAQLLKEQAEAINLKEERTRRADVVKNADNKYTIAWFLNLLELVRVQEKSATMPEVTFFKCERVPSAQKTFELSESDGRIPANLESFDEIPAVITYSNMQGEASETTTKLIASEKYQKLWVVFPEAAIHPILDHVNKIRSIKLQFTRRIDLIEELKNGFRRLGLHDSSNLKAALSPNINFIYGPPGTGKTTELANRILGRAKQGVSGPVVVLTPTNKAADVLAKKIIELNGKIAPYWLIRAGSCTDPFLLRENVVKSGADLLIESNSNSVLITTIHRFPYFTIPISPNNVETARLCDCPWSLVIFDESSMIPVAYITHAIHVRQLANPKTEFLVAGDPLQIPPVFDLLVEDLEDFAEELQQENIYKMVGLASFDKAVQQTIPVYATRIHNLEIQHRSIPAIGELFSKFQYGGKIKHSRGTMANKRPLMSRPLPQKMIDLGIKPITIIRYPVKSGDSIFKPQKLDGSPMHLYSSLMVNELVKILREGVRGKNEEPWSVGLLAPYRSQADVMLKMIEAHNERTAEVVITTDTVHGFQGDENDIVFAVLNPSGTGRDISFSRFLKKEFILNVAISRAQDYLILFIPDEDSKGIDGLPLLHQLVMLANETPSDLLTVIHSSELENRLMGNSRFFEMKTLSSAHQKVNVYGKPDLPYMIRLNENSLDVHWQV